MGALLGGGTMAWVVGAVVTALVLAGMQQLRNAGYAQAETNNLRAVAQAEREANEKTASDIAWLRARHAEARHAENALRLEVDAWRKQAESLERAAIHPADTIYCQPGCLLPEVGNVK